jgi:2-dehydro-3-deoxygluconokinase
VTDVFTLGETMVRLTPKGYTRLEEAGELEVRVGGSESNVAVALARLGLSAAWASRLPRNALGALTERRIRGFGVDTSAVRWVDDARMGLYFIEPGAPPRSGAVLYDRAGSAAAGMQPEDFNWSRLDDCRHLHLTGITPALGPGPAATAARALAEARRRGLTVSFDVNYRARLWSAAAARAALTPLLAEVDLLICPAADAGTVFGLPEAPEAAARGLRALAPRALVAVTLGGGGALLWDGAAAQTAAAFPVQAVDRVGAGDAFDAGLLWGFLQGDPARGLAFGMAMAALKHTMPGDEFIGSREEVEALLQTGHQDIRR